MTTYDKEKIELQLVTLLMNIIEGDYSEFLDKANRLKKVAELTKQQKQCIDAPLGMLGYSVISKTKAIDMISKIAGLNQLKHNIGSDEDNPLTLKVQLEYVTAKPHKEESSDDE